MRQKIILTVGLPASGKTTWAKQYINERFQSGEKWKRINKDDLRAMLDNGLWSKTNEKMILDTRDNLIVTFLARDCNIIIDDTNLDPRHEKQIRELFENKDEEGNEVVVAIKSFIDVPLEECLKRDKERPNYVGEDVIKRMWKKWLRPEIEKVPYIDGLPEIVVCDLDGTIALFGEEDPYNRDFSKDQVNEPITKLLFTVARDNLRNIIFLSGRMDKYRNQTEAWLRDNDIPYEKDKNPLFMRKTNDSRPDFEVKRELYEKHIKGKFNVLFVLDDRNQVVDLWRSLGLTCLQVAEGEF